MTTARSEVRRQRIVEAASRLMFQFGVGATTLADVADEAGVPIGGLYYYFRTKSDLVTASLERHRQLQRAVFADIEQASDDPVNRIRLYISVNRTESKWASGGGCEHGLLSMDLLRSRDEISTRADELLGDHLRWLETNVRNSGAADPDTVAAYLLAQIQGAYLVAAVTRQPELVKAQLELLDTQLEHILDLGPERMGATSVPSGRAR